MRYYISDLHFFHENMNHINDKRGFASTEEMNEYMIRQWNGRVRRNDEVVILGDFSYGKAEETNELLKQLNGKKHLIIGNHDYFLNDKAFDRDLLVWAEYYREVHDNNRKVILCHYPVFCYHGQNRLTKEGKPTAYMLYGHVHNTYDEVLVNAFQNMTRETKRTLRRGEEPQGIPCNMINCFCMFSDYIPLTLDEWIEKDRERRLMMSRYSDDTHSESSQPLS